MFTGATHLIRDFKPSQQRHHLLLEVLLLQGNDTIRTYQALQHTEQTHQEPSVWPHTKEGHYGACSSQPLHP